MNIIKTVTHNTKKSGRPVSKNNILLNKLSKFRDVYFTKLVVHIIIEII